MRVIIRFKQGEDILFENLGELTTADDFARIVGEAVDDFRTTIPDAPLWDLTISINKYGYRRRKMENRGLRSPPKGLNNSPANRPGNLILFLGEYSLPYFFIQGKVALVV